MKLVSISNKRPVQEDLGCVFIVSQTEGKLRISGKTAELLEVGDEDYVGVVKDTETGDSYLFKGMKDENTQIGNKLASAGNNFEFGSKNVWDELGGKEVEGGLKYDVSETPVEFEDTKYFKLENKTEIPKSTRGKKTDGTNEDSADPIDSVEDTQKDTDEVSENPEGFSLD